MNDSDPLLGFEEESGENRREIAQVAPVENDDRRVDVEKLIHQTQQEIAQIRSEIATLVGAVEDMKKRRLPTSQGNSVQAPAAWTSAITATLGIVVGILIGMMIWMQLSGTKPIPLGGAPRETQPAAVPAASGTSPEVSPGDPAEVPLTTPARDPQTSIKSIAQRVQPTIYVGALSITSDPAGEVFVNQQDAGRTPVRLDKLRAGSHVIWIERAGYQRWSRVVQVQADTVTHLSAELEPNAR